MSGTGNVGTSAVYEAGDQRNPKQNAQGKNESEGDRFHDGKENSHLANDAKDERTIANKLEREAKREQEKDEPKTEEDRARKQDATLPAINHGNEPSKGAKIDQQLREEEEAELKKKGDFGPAKSN